MSLFGSSPNIIDANVASVASALHIPYFSTSKTSVSHQGAPQNFVIHLGPQTEHLVQAVVDLVKEFNWNHVAYVVHRQTGKEKQY